MVSHVPEDLVLDIGFFSFERRFTRKKNEIVVSEVSRCKRAQLPKEDYQKIKSFFDELPQKTKQRIMLKKIHPLLMKIRAFIEWVFRHIRTSPLLGVPD